MQAVTVDPFQLVVQQLKIRDQQVPPVISLDDEGVQFALALFKLKVPTYVLTGALQLLSD
ncbi:hypothetical protein GCM10023095_16090 [Pseudaeromonas paramecii]|uniref:Uncharacterized protein n=1 Tax=Pseudaeromonas paramecii TaxID=2138166 RepID=A0ABP8Q7N1_9GAMM